MAKVTFMYPVADVCGKIGDAPIGFAHRGNTKFTVKYGKRTTAVTPGEMTQRQRFTQAVNNTRTRMTDPTQQQKDQAAFAAQTAYKTLYQFIFNDEYKKLQ